MTPTEPRKRLGARIRALREARGWTQADLAQACGMHRTYVSAIEHGARNTSFDNLLRLAEVFDVSLGELLSDL